MLYLYIDFISLIHMMAESLGKRISKPNLNLLLDRSHEKSTELDLLCSKEIDTLNDGNVLKDHIASIKSVYKEYSLVTHESIVSLYASGSPSEANELKDSRDEKRRDIKEIIAFANNKLETLGIEDNISSLDSISQYSSGKSPVHTLVESSAGYSQHVELMPNNPLVATALPPTHVSRLEPFALPTESPMVTRNDFNSHTLSKPTTTSSAPFHYETNPVTLPSMSKKYFHYWLS